MPLPMVMASRPKTRWFHSHAFLSIFDGRQNLSRMKARTMLVAFLLTLTVDRNADLYMLKGHFQHSNGYGNVGELRSGGGTMDGCGSWCDSQWNADDEEGALHGFQIWHKPASNTKMPAQYHHDFQSEKHCRTSRWTKRFIAEWLQVDLSCITKLDDDSEALCCSKDHYRKQVCR